MSPTAESDTKGCHRCGQPAACYADIDGGSAPLCLHCRLEQLRNEFERRGGSPELLASFPRRRSGTTTAHGFAHLDLAQEDAEDLDAENLEVLDWAVRLLGDDAGMKSAGALFSGLAGVVARGELPTAAKNAVIDNLGVLALDRVELILLLNHCPRRG